MAAAQQTFYVSPTGSGTTFTQSQPGALPDVVAKIRSAAPAMTGDIVVLIQGGWYALSSTLSLDQGCSGTSGHNVIFAAGANEFPVISGGRRIAGWTLHDAAKGIWKAAAPGINTRQLYVNCARAVRARKSIATDPNNGMPVPNGPLSGTVAKTNTGFMVTGGGDLGMANWGNKSDIEFIFNANFGSGGDVWRERRVGVQSISLTGTTMTITMKQPGFSNACILTSDYSYGSPPRIPCDVENAYELLDQPGEWYLDRSAETIYYKPRTGETMDAAVVIAPVLETLVSVSGSDATPVHDIQFKGITFAHATWLYPSSDSGFPERQANYFPDAMPAGTTVRRVPGNVACLRANRIRFERCIFKHLGAAGLDISGGSQNCSVVGCQFSDVSGTSVAIGNNLDPMRPDLSTRDTSDTVMNCYFSNTPAEYRGGCAVVAAYVSGVVLAHNEVNYTYYTGFSIGWGGWTGVASYMKNNEFRHNSFANIMPNLSGGPMMYDGGPMYTQGDMPGTKWHHNWMRDFGVSIGAIYPDEGTAHVEIYQNLITGGGGDWIHMWTGSIRDNIIHDNFTTHTGFNNSGTRCTITNTTVFTEAGAWPQGALDIKNSAGVEAAFAGVKTMECACSIAGSTSILGQPDAWIRASAARGLSIRQRGNAVAVTAPSGAQAHVSIVDFRGRQTSAANPVARSRLTASPRELANGIYLAIARTGKERACLRFVAPGNE